MHELISSDSAIDPLVPFSRVFVASEQVSHILW